MSMNYLIGEVFLALAVVAPGCSGDRCEGNLAEVGATCPRSFDGTPASFPACEQETDTYQSRLCGDLIVLYRINTSGGGCFYDASSHQLVGSQASSDIPSYCDGSSFAIYAGRVPDSCTSEPIATKDCFSQL
jgi:hypothetical protein